MARPITIDEIRERLRSGELFAMEAPAIIFALCDAVEMLEAEVADLRALAVELETASSVLEDRIEEVGG